MYEKEKVGLTMVLVMIEDKIKHLTAVKSKLAELKLMLDATDIAEEQS